jgi:protein ImuB
MQQRYVCVWLQFLKTDWHSRRQPLYSTQPLVLYQYVHNKMLVSAANSIAIQAGLAVGTALADAKAIVPALVVLQDDTIFFETKLNEMAQWFLRYSPVIAAYTPDSILIDATGCTHLWGGESAYLEDIAVSLKAFGYSVKLAIAGSIGAAWALAHYAASPAIVAPGEEAAALTVLPPVALRIQPEAIALLQKLGMQQIQDFMHLPIAALKRRFGAAFVTQLQYALGYLHEPFPAIVRKPVWEEKLNCISPIVNQKGMETALQLLLDAMCSRLQKAGLGLRKAICTCYRGDNTSQQMEITLINTCNEVQFLQQLFSHKIAAVYPEPGIVLFSLLALDVGICRPQQEAIWVNTSANSAAITTLFNKMANRIGTDNIFRFFPDEHYWPERAVKAVLPHETVVPATVWKKWQTRPVLLLQYPIRIQVAAPIPDYPPMLFRWQEQVFKIIKADGPERIAQEWWLQQGEHRDYYYVEVEAGNRYWIFRLGHYNALQKDQWFLHGYCA